MQVSRVRRPKSVAQSAYNRMSHFYDWLAGSSETRLIHQGIELLAVSPGESVLEVGCGTGKALVEFCRQAGDQAVVFGLDLSSGMLQVASSRLLKNYLRRSINLLEGDGQALPLQSCIFSAIFMSFTLELFDTPEIPQVLSECQRVLKPGGRLVVVAMSMPNQSSWIVRLYEWFHTHFPAYVDCRPINAQAMIQAAGFSIEKQLEESMWGLPVILIRATR